MTLGASLTKEAQLRTIEYQGVTIEYDETCPRKWSWQRAIASGDDNRIFNAFDRLLGGKADEIAMEYFDDDVETMKGLIAEVLKTDTNAKN